MLDYILVALSAIFTSYIFFRRSGTILWAGSVLLFMGDKSLVPVRWSPFDWGIGANKVVLGFYLPGAYLFALPRVTIRGPWLRDKEKQDEFGHIFYLSIEAENGVYIMFNKPLSGKEVSHFILDVDSVGPWKGGHHTQSIHEPAHYLRYVMIHFNDKENPYHV